MKPGFSGVSGLTSDQRGAETLEGGSDDGEEKSDGGGAGGSGGGKLADELGGEPWDAESISSAEASEVPPFPLETLRSNFFVSVIQDLHTIIKSKWGPH